MEITSTQQNRSFQRTRQSESIVEWPKTRDDDWELLQADLSGIPGDSQIDNQRIIRFLDTLTADLCQGMGVLAGFYQPSQPYVHLKALSFVSGAQKTVWMRNSRGSTQPDTEWMPDAHLADVFSRFWKQPKRGKRTWLGFCRTYNFSTVYEPNVSWEDRQLHAWAVLVMTDSNREKHLLIWDCEPRLPTKSRRRQERLWSTQLAMVRMAEKEIAVRSVWVNEDNSPAGRFMCVAFTFWWIQKMVTYGDLTFQGTEDPRLRGCVRLQLR